MKTSVFYQKLLDYLIECHPDKIKNMGDDIEDFIVKRCKIAEDSLEDSLKKGINIDVAKEIAYNLLFEGLIFSRYDYVLNCLEENYPEKYSILSDNGQLRNLILSCVEKCNDLFEKHVKGDDFPGNNDLYYQVLGKIDIELEKNVLQ